MNAFTSKLIANAIYILFITQIRSQYTEIWFDNMDSNSGWTSSDGSLVMFGFSSAGCTTSVCLKTEGSFGVDAYAYRFTNVAAYSSLQLQFDVSTDDMESGKTCTVYYAYNSQSNKQQIAAIDPPNEDRFYYEDKIVTLPSASSATSVCIWLETTTNGDTTSSYDRCYWDNVYLRGIVSTVQPTPNPSNPTHHPTQPPSNPTKTPTNKPTQSPIQRTPSPSQTPVTSSPTNDSPPPTGGTPSPSHITSSPTQSNVLTPSPTDNTPSPTDNTPTPTQSDVLTPSPTDVHVLTPSPTDVLTSTPTQSNVLTPSPTDMLTPSPTDILTPTPTSSPSDVLTSSPAHQVVTSHPTQGLVQTSYPTQGSVQTSHPTSVQTSDPTQQVMTSHPTSVQTSYPTQGSVQTSHPTHGLVQTSPPTEQQHTMVPSSAPTPHTWSSCVDEEIEFSDAYVRIHIETDASNRAMKLQLTAPQNIWFGIGFGATVMHQTPVITVATGDSGMTVVRSRLLEEHTSGTVISNVLNDHVLSVIEQAGFRMATIIKPWVMVPTVLDLSDFFDGIVCELPIIWARGASDTIVMGYHGTDNRGAVVLRSCACTEDPTDMPSQAPSQEPSQGVATTEEEDDVLTSEADDVRWWFGTWLFVISSFIFNF